MRNIASNLTVHSTKNDIWGTIVTFCFVVKMCITQQEDILREEIFMVIQAIGSSYHVDLSPLM